MATLRPLDNDAIPNIQSSEEFDVQQAVKRVYEKLAEKLPGFETRKEQYDLTVAIATALYKQQHLAAQAPTGTGKSFAVTLAVIAVFLVLGKRAILSTANNSLLEQYAKKDFPFLKKIFPDMRWARAKGKNNYACIDKGEKIFGQQTLFEESETLKKLREWYENTQSGDKEEIRFSVPEVEWGKINADDSCTGKKCPFYDECHYFKAKQQIKQADIIVTNFDLVLLDLFNPEIELFPLVDAIIFDEAHELEDKAISKLETSLTEGQIGNYMRKAEKEYSVDPSFLANITPSIAPLFSAYKKLLAQGEEKKSIIPDENLKTLTVNFQSAMTDLRNKVYQHKTKPDTRERRAQEKFMDNILGAGHAAVSAVTNDKRHVSWVEATKTDIKIVTCPYRVASMLHKMLFSNPRMAIICLSATLGFKGNGLQMTMQNGQLVPVSQFEQFRNRVGMVQAAEFDCPSPFNYRENCILYLPKPPEDITNPNVPGYTTWMLEEVEKLVKLSRGRAFVLTTSNKSLKSISSHLAANTPLQVKAQNPTIANSQLIEWFKETENAVLVGTASFWQGVSIEGDDLKLVVIDKLPFIPHTEPIQQARQMWYDADPVRKKKSFMELQVFPATIRMNQGFGRLIRTKTDTGVVAILDPRVTYARYKNVILNNLPNAYRTTFIEDQRLINALH